MNNIYKTLTEIKIQLFDAPSDVKEAFNQMIDYFSDSYSGSSYSGSSYSEEDRKNSQIYQNNVNILRNVGNYFREHPDEYNTQIQKIYNEVRSLQKI